MDCPNNSNYENKAEKYKYLDQDWAEYAVVCKYRDIVMNQWSNVFYFQIIHTNFFCAATKKC